MAWNNTGSVVITAGAMVGTGTLFLSSFVGDAFVDENNGKVYELATITDNTHATVAYTGLSGTFANGAWSILPCSPLRQTTATLNNLLGTIIGTYGSVLSVAGADKTATLNKTLSTNNAGMITQTGGVIVGRVGAFGDNNMHVAVSPDGAAWIDGVLINMTTGLATLYGDPTAALGATTKQYVDGTQVTHSIRLASSVNVTTSNPGTVTYDSVAASAGDVVLLYGQVTPSQNGPWIVGASTSTALVRPAWWATGYAKSGALLVIQEGTANAGKTFQLTTTGTITVGTTALTFTSAATGPITATTLAVGGATIGSAVLSALGQSNFTGSGSTLAALFKPIGNAYTNGAIGISNSGATNVAYITAVGSQLNLSATGATDDLILTNGAAQFAGNVTVVGTISVSGNVSNLKVPTRQVLTSGSSATYTTPAGVRQLRIRMWGGGGAGASNSNNGNNGGAGGNTIFNSINAAGGAGGTNDGGGGAGGTGGSGSASLRVPGTGGAGGYGIGTGFGVSASGGLGGTGPLGGAPVGSNNSAANTGAGGPGGSGSSFTGTTGGGGGSGEYVEYIINSPAGTYTYTIGAGGTTTSAGSFGFGCNGGSGEIIVEEIY